MKKDQNEIVLVVSFPRNDKGSGFPAQRSVYGSGKRNKEEGRMDKSKIKSPKSTRWGHLRVRVCRHPARWMSTGDTFAQGVRVMISILLLNQSTKRCGYGVGRVITGVRFGAFPVRIGTNIKG